MTVHQIRPLRISKATTKCVNRLLQLALLRKLTGIAFIGYVEDGFIADVCGDAYTQPDRTLEMLPFLAQRLRERKGHG